MLIKSIHLNILATQSAAVASVESQSISVDADQDIVLQNIEELSISETDSNLDGASITREIHIFH